MDTSIYEGCQYGKSHRLKFGTKIRASVPGEVIHGDVCGPFERSFSGYHYYVLFIDDFSHYSFIYYIKETSEVSQKFNELIKEVSRSGNRIQFFISDNGDEFDNKMMKSILNKYGVEQLLTAPYSPEINGFVERDNRTVVEAARSMLHSRGNLPQSLWAVLTNSSVYILNRTGNSGDKDKTPYELWFAKKPYIKNLRIIGCECFVHTPKQKRRKMDCKATKGILVGYDYGGYRIWIPGRGTLVRSRDVIFNEVPLTPSITATPLVENQTKEIPGSGTKYEEKRDKDFDGFDDVEEKVVKDNPGMTLRNRANLKKTYKIYRICNTSYE